MELKDDSLINRADMIPDRPFNSIVRPCLAEFVGVLLFVFIGCMAVQDPLGVAGTSPSAPAVALAHGFTITLLVISLGSISGAHINPAVTLGVLISGAITPFMAAVYFLAQCTGGIIGAALVRAVLPLEVYKAIGGGAHILTAVGPGPGILCEMMLTTVLVLTVLLSAVDDRNKSNLAGVAIGFAVAVCILAGINTTGASMNPARSLGPAVSLSVYNSGVWTYHYVYWVGPALGSICASLIYRLILASPEKRWLFKY